MHAVGTLSKKNWVIPENLAARHQELSHRWCDEKRLGGPALLEICQFLRELEAVGVSQTDGDEKIGLEAITLFWLRFLAGRASEVFRDERQPVKPQVSATGSAPSQPAPLRQPSKAVSTGVTGPNRRFRAILVAFLALPSVGLILSAALAWNTLVAIFPWWVWLTIIGLSVSLPALGSLHCDMQEEGSVYPEEGTLPWHQRWPWGRPTFLEERTPWGDWPTRILAGMTILGMAGTILGLLWVWVIGVTP